MDTCFESGVSLEASSQELEAGLLRCCDVAMLRSCCGLVADFLSVFINKDGGCSDVADFEGGMPRFSRPLIDVDEVDGTARIFLGRSEVAGKFGFR